MLSALPNHEIEPEIKDAVLYQIYPPFLTAQDGNLSLDKTQSDKVLKIWIDASRFHPYKIAISVGFV